LSFTLLKYYLNVKIEKIISKRRESIAGKMQVIK